MGALIVFLVLVLAWVLFSGRLTARSVTAPIVLTVAGFLLAMTPGGVDLDLDAESVRELIEVTLAVVLFTDASSIGLRWFATEWRYPLRLLGIGLPMTVALGALVAWWLFPGTDVWVACLVAAALAPTDAALGTSIIEDERIPLAFRRVINVESGLNDGIATPIVSFFIAAVITTDEGTGSRPLVEAVLSIALAVAVGGVVGRLSGLLLRGSEERGWVLPKLLPIAPVVIAVATYSVVVALHGNGFVAAFVCGVAFGGTLKERAREEHVLFTEQVGLLLGFAVWFVFGAGVLAKVIDGVTWQMVAYAVLSLTVLRMVPVAVSAIGLRLPWDTVALGGWLGPRGLASIVFAILAFDDIGGEQGTFVLVLVAVTVAMSVVAHGISAGPLATWYAGRHPVVDGPAVGEAVRD